MNDDPEDDIPTLIDVDRMPKEHFTVYGIRNQTIAVSYEANNGQYIVFELDERYQGLSSGEILSGMPDGDKSWDVEADELWSVVTALSNIEAKTPSFEDFFLSMKEFWKIISFYQWVPLPASIGEVFVDRPEIRQMMLSESMTLNERIVRLMMAITDFYGSFDRVFGRYVVICDEPITTSSMEEAVLEKMKLSGQLIDVRVAL